MTTETIDWLNDLNDEAAAAEFLRCCGSRWWCKRLAAARPFRDSNHVADKVEQIFDAMPEEAWLEAIRSHPKIGDFESLKMKYAGNRDWSAGEQAGAAEADDDTLRKLAEGNATYEERFGYLFVVCATGKSAAEMLALLESRLHNDPADELAIASTEQQKITWLRLAKMQPPSEEP